MQALLSVEAALVLPGEEQVCQVGSWFPDTPEGATKWLVERVVKEWLHRLWRERDKCRYGTGVVIEVIPSGQLMASACMKDASIRQEKARTAPYWDSICTAVALEKKGQH